MDEIILISRDNKRFLISLKAGEQFIYICWLAVILLLIHLYSERFDTRPRKASLSKYVCNFKEMFESEPNVHCSRVSSNCLAKVVEFLNRHEQEPMKTINTPLIDHTFEGVVKQQWYRDYIDVNDQLLSEMLAAADFMDIGEYFLFVVWGHAILTQTNTFYSF